MSEFGHLRPIHFPPGPINVLFRSLANADRRHLDVRLVPRADINLVRALNGATTTLGQFTFARAAMAANVSV